MFSLTSALLGSLISRLVWRWTCWYPRHMDETEPLIPSSPCGMKDRAGAQSREGSQAGGSCHGDHPFTSVLTLEPESHLLVSVPPTLTPRARKAGCRAVRMTCQLGVTLCAMQGSSGKVVGMARARPVNCCFSVTGTSLSSSSFSCTSVAVSLPPRLRATCQGLPCSWWCPVVCTTGEWISAHGVDKGHRH